MLRPCLTLIACLLNAVAGAQLTLDVTSIPTNTPEDDVIYVAGNFNGWQPGEPA